MLHTKFYLLFFRINCWTSWRNHIRTFDFGCICTFIRVAVFIGKITTTVRHANNGYCNKKPTRNGIWSVLDSNFEVNIFLYKGDFKNKNKTSFHLTIFYMLIFEITVYYVELPWLWYWCELVLVLTLKHWKN